MDSLLRSGVDELQHFGMEAKAVDRRGLIAMTVLAVSNNRTTFARQMDTNLIRTTGLEVEFYEGIN